LLGPALDALWAESDFTKLLEDGWPTSRHVRPRILLCDTRWDNSCEKFRNPLHLLSARHCYTATRANPWPRQCTASARTVKLRSPVWTACEPCDCLV